MRAHNLQTDYVYNRYGTYRTGDLKVLLCLKSRAASRRRKVADEALSRRIGPCRSWWVPRGGRREVAILVKCDVRHVWQFGSIAVMDDQQRERCRASCEAMAAGAIAAARALADGETRPDRPDQQVVEALKALATAQTTLTETQRALINAALDAGVSVRRTAAAAGRPVVTVQKWRKDAKESD